MEFGLFFAVLAKRGYYRVIGMTTYGSYLVCKDYIAEVKDFLGQFFEEQEGKYNHDAWVTFIVPGSNFKINLMRGEDQPITQNMTFEIYCNSFKELRGFAEQHGCDIQDFLATGAVQKYQYHYIEIPGPQNICKVEVNYCEDA